MLLLCDVPSEETKAYERLRQPVKDFFEQLLHKAYQAGETFLSMKKEEFAEVAGKDMRTVSRYFDKLESTGMITQKGIRGRKGKHVIFFDTERVRFPKNDDAVVHSDNPATVEQAVEQVRPKPTQKKEPTRKRRTNKQIRNDDEFLQKKKSETEEINDRLEKNGTDKVWEILQDTENPINNYRTYLISRLYNQYMFLFREEIIKEAEDMGEESSLELVTSNYDVLSDRFYKTTLWSTFDKLRERLQEWDIAPELYLSAQFEAFKLRIGTQKQSYPFPNQLISEDGYKHLKSYYKYHYMRGGQSIRMYDDPPARFMTHPVVRALTNEYKFSEKEYGITNYRRVYRTLYSWENTVTKTEEALTTYFHIMKDNILERKTNSAHGTLLKYIGIQSLLATRQLEAFPEYIWLGNEIVQHGIMVQQDPDYSKEDNARMSGHFIGKQFHADKYLDQQNAHGLYTYLMLTDLDENMQLLRMITKRRGLNTSLKEVSQAMQEVGPERIPVTEESFLDVQAVVQFVSHETEVSFTNDRDPDIPELGAQLNSYQYRKRQAVQERLDKEQVDNFDEVQALVDKELENVWEE